MRHLKTFDYIQSISRTGSIRKTAERMNITPSSLTRKIQDFEQELGCTVFERLPQGMRLNAAGELLLRHIQAQLSDLERLRSQIADLSGIRRGHVAVACSQAFLDHILPEEVAAYRTRFPLVSFDVQMRDHALGVAALASFEADIALVLNPPPFHEITVLSATKHRLCALMRKDHPLAGQGELRLRACVDHPLAIPDTTLAIRHILDAAFAHMRLSPTVAAVSGSLEFLRNQVLREPLLTFQVALGAPLHEDLVLRPLDIRDIPLMPLILGHARGRSLPIAAAKFAEQLSARIAGFESA
jgi:DNA-binding transcriptional LysR family regulator